MNEADIKHFKTLIHERKREIAALDKVGSDDLSAVELDQTRVGRLSRMDAMQIHQMNLETTRRRQRELLQLDAALERINQGDFGECHECGAEINPMRLEIDLVATLCISCANEKERNNI